MLYIRGVKKEMSRNLECANRWQYCCVCNKEWFRQALEVHCPLLEGHGCKVTWLKASRNMRQSSNAITLHTVQIWPCDYAIFGPLKKPLSVKRFTSDDNLKQYVWNWFTTQPREFDETPFTALCRSVTSASTAMTNTSDIQVLVSVPRPPARFFLNAPHI